MFATLEATSQLNWEAKDPVVGSPTPSEEDRGNSVGERGAAPLLVETLFQDVTVVK